MFKSWNIKPQQTFKSSYKKIDWLIDLVTTIRSTKVDLNVSPGSFIDISTSEINSNKTRIINDNLDVFKRLGRVTNVNNSRSHKNGVKIIVGGETVTLYFDQNLDLKEQKHKLSNKVQDLDKKIISIKSKLKNKSFLKNAPKQLISKDKKALINDNLDVFKRLGRVTNVNNSKSDKNGVKIIVGRETVILYFDQNLDLNEQKQKLSSKVKDLDNKIITIKSKLKNKSFLKNAPKQIVSRDKKALIEYEIELKKLNSILNSIKN